MRVCGCEGCKGYTHGTKGSRDQGERWGTMGTKEMVTITDVGCIIVTITYDYNVIYGFCGFCGLYGLYGLFGLVGSKELALQAVIVQGACITTTCTTAFAMIGKYILFVKFTSF